MRLDLYLTTSGLADSRQRAKVLISANCVVVNGKTVSKAAYDVGEFDVVTVTNDPIGYVGRGALKLESAFKVFDIDANDKVAIDVGASTGGFTDFLLKNGAKKVYAVDSGIGQLAEKLKNDSRVVSMEKYNARYLIKEDFLENIELAVMDVSFISQTLIIPSLVNVLSQGGIFVSLVKPQFEAGREAVGKGGIVKNPASRAMAIRKVIDCALANGFSLMGLTVSPIKGGDGNTEYLACFYKGECETAYSGNIDLLISNTVNL